MAQKNNNSLFDLVFKENSPQSDSIRNPSIYDVVLKETTVNLTVKENDITISSTFIEQYNSRVNLKIINL